jgi:hypothetical protein
MTTWMEPVRLNERTRAMVAGMSPEAVARWNEHAARLRRYSETVIAGPRADRFGNVWVPSPECAPGAVAEWRRHGGEFRKLTERGELVDAWMFRRGRLGLDEARVLYGRFFGAVVERERVILGVTG